MLSILTDKAAAGCVIVTALVAVQLCESVAVTVYTPAIRLLTELEVPKLLHT